MTLTGTINTLKGIKTKKNGQESEGI